MKKDFMFGLIFLSFVLFNSVGVVSGVETPQITEVSYTPSLPIDSLQRIDGTGIDESFAIYGNVNNAPNLHYVEYDPIPDNCFFDNTEPDYGIGGSYVENSQNRKVFSDSPNHNFKFMSFRCNKAGEYRFAVKLIGSNGEILHKLSNRILIESLEIRCSQKSITCSDGTIVSPDPDNGCSFPSCPTPECIDSDGKNYEITGYTFGLEAPEAWDNFKDYCGVAGNEIGKVVEYICKDNNYVEKELYDCSEDTPCVNGACIMGGRLEDTTLIAGQGFRYAKWECYDGTAESQGEETSCKSSELWQIYAGEFCKGKCSEESGKCGVNSFSVGGDCSDDSGSSYSGEPLSFGYEVAVWMCEDGRVGKETSADCKLGYLWEKEIEELCGEAGIDDIDLEEKCGITDGSGFTSTDISLICKNSCPFEGSCLPIGVRTGGKYCGINGELSSQLEGNAQCDNNFECGSNVCVSGQCVETNLIEKILEWFRKLFGGEQA